MSEETPNTNTTNNNEETYQIAAISFEDSQVDHFIPYSSPSMLAYETRQACNKPTPSNNNESSIEQARGIDSQSNTILIAMPLDSPQSTSDQSHHKPPDENTNTSALNANASNLHLTLTQLPLITDDQTATQHQQQQNDDPFSSDALQIDTSVQLAPSSRHEGPLLSSSSDSTSYHEFPSCYTSLKKKALKSATLDTINSSTCDAANQTSEKFHALTALASDSLTTDPLTTVTNPHPATTATTTAKDPLNTSSSSTTSTCKTDTLGKRVQDLIGGPIKLDPPAIDITRIQKDLDGIQSKLREQRIDETPSTRSILNPYLPTRVGRHLLHETPMRLSTTALAQPNINTQSLDSPVNYSTLFSKSVDYHSSTFCAEPPRRSAADATTSPIKFIPLSPSFRLAESEQSNQYYTRRKSPTKSAFDDDPEVILRKNGVKSVSIHNNKDSVSNKIETTLGKIEAALNKHEIAERTLQLHESLLPVDGFNAIDRATCKIMSQLRYYDDTPLSTQRTVSASEGVTETVESTHSGSDDARPPRFPVHVFGSREEPRAPHEFSGIYDKKRKDSLPMPVVRSEANFVDVSHLRQPNASLVNCEHSVSFGERRIGEGEKRFSEGEKKFNEGERVKRRQNAIAWDINVDGSDNVSLDDVVPPPPAPQQTMVMNLKGDLVKKLQGELGLRSDKDLAELPEDVQALWMQFQEKVRLYEAQLKKKAANECKDKDCSDASESSEKENRVSVISDAATQTSFAATATAIAPKLAKSEDVVLHRVSNKSVSNNNNNGVRVSASEGDVQKMKIHAIIKKQKLEHEKRVRQLEKLAKLERLQAEKLKEIMLNQTNCTNADSTIVQSEVGEESAGSDLTIDAVDTTADIDEELARLRLRNERAMKMRALAKQLNKEPHCDTKSYVQVLNLKNTSVYEPPQGFAVIKERQNNLNNNLNNNNSNNSNNSNRKESKMSMALQQQQQQTNELHTDEDGRIFVTIPRLSIGNFMQVSPKGNSSTAALTRNSKSAQNLQAVKAAGAKNCAWFQPVTIVSESTRQPLKSAPVNTIKPNEKREVFEAPLEKIQPRNNSQIKGLKKLSLQEACEMFNFDFISRSRKRQREIQLRADQRRMDEQFKNERIRLGIACGDDMDKFSAQRKSSYGSVATMSDPVGERLFLAQRRQMTADEIRQQTCKLYSKLPEVKERMKKQRVEEDKKRNRVKSSLYNKTIQQRVLTKGPNFNMNYKALESVL